MRLALLALVLVSGCSAAPASPDAASTDTSLPDAPTPDASLLDASGASDAWVCSAPSDCPSPGGTCASPTCEAGACGVALVDDGTLLTAQTDGDCRRIVCDGTGGTRTENDDTDALDDGNDCTVDACAAGAPTSTPAPPGTPCASGTCDASGACT